MDGLLSRRRFLAATGAALGAAAAPGLLGGRPAAAADPAPLPPPAESGIDHVVVVTMENRSFDHYLGWLPGADGVQAGLTFVDRYGVPHGTWRLTGDYQGCTHPDPDHSFAGGRVELNGGACDGWLRAGDNDVFAIGYYGADDLAFHGRAAPAWTVCDRYFSAIMAETYPNRFYQHAAATDRLANSTALCTLPTIWDRLAAAGLRGTYYFHDAPFTALWGTRYAAISRPYAAFLADCAAGTLPEVAFVDPKFLDEGSGTSADDHPHGDIRAGQSFLHQVYAAVTSSPAWPRTLLVVTYDEWGGFFDHVAPPTAPDTDPDRGQRGFRVPCLVVSPRARRGYVAHDVYDHTSVLAAIEWRWGLDPLSPRDAAARNLAEVLDFANPPDLAAPRWAVPPAVSLPCPPSQVGAVPDAADFRALRDLALAHGWSLPA